MMRLLACGVLALNMLLLIGCSDRRTTARKAQDWAREAQQAHAEVDAAAARSDAKAARKAADRVTARLTDLRKLSPDATLPAAEHEKLVATAEAAAVAAQETAGLTEEKLYLSDKINSWTAKGYRSASALALRGIFEGLALAADQAAKGSLSSLPQPIQDSASAAASLDRVLTGRPLLPSGLPDYAAIAASLHAAAASPPDEVHLLLATGLLCSARTDMALYEIQMVAPGRIASPTPRMAAIVLRSFIYNVHGLRRLSLQELNSALAPAGAATPDDQVLIHLLIASILIQDKQYGLADQQLTDILKIAPNHPLTVFITGERLLADGRHEQAAATLENALPGTRQDWIARKIAARARQIRDEKGASRPLLTDPTFITELALQQIAVSAGDAAKEQMQSWLGSAKAFAGRLLTVLPGGSTPATSAPAPSTAPTPATSPAATLPEAP